MRKIDRDALTRAIAMLRLESPGRSRQIDDKLAEEPWENVAEWCAYCCQCDTVRLRPWQTPPCWIYDIRATLAAGDGDNKPCAQRSKPTRSQSLVSRLGQPSAGGSGASFARHARQSFF